MAAPAETGLPAPYVFRLDGYSTLGHNGMLARAGASVATVIGRIEEQGYLEPDTPSERYYGAGRVVTAVARWQPTVEVRWPERPDPKSWGIVSEINVSDSLYLTRKIKGENQAPTGRIRRQTRLFYAPPESAVAFYGDAEFAVTFHGDDVALDAVNALRHPYAPTPSQLTNHVDILAYEASALLPAAWDALVAYNDAQRQALNARQEVPAYVV